MDLIKINNCIKQYKILQSESTRKEILNEISKFVTDFPIIIKRNCDYDHCLDFYCFFLEKFDKVVLNFDENGSGFRTWLSVCLRNLYSHFIYRSKYTVYDQQIPVENTILENYPQALRETESKYEEVNSPLLDFFDKKRKKNVLEYLCLKLHHYDFFLEKDAVLLHKYTGKRYSDVLQFLDKVIDLVYTRNVKRDQIELKLSNLHSRITRYFQLAENSEDSKLKLESLQQRRHKLILKRDAIKTSPDATIIADFLKISPGQVYKINLKFKNEIKLLFKKENPIEKSKRQTA